jgi:hypothetical protein
LLFSKSLQKAPLLISCLSSFVFDYAAKMSVGGTHMNFYILKQLPVLSPDQYSESAFNFILPRSLELIYTAYDLKPFAIDCGYDGPPFIWNKERRFLLRCELDSLYFKLYGLNKEEAEYVMESFPIVKRKDIEQYGTYRTKEVILKYYDEIEI